MNSQSFHTWENPTNHAYTHTHVRISSAKPIQMEKNMGKISRILFQNGEEHVKDK